jgi:hypothetical protein
MGDELAAGGMLHGGGDAHLDTELIRPMRLALAYALHFWSVHGRLPAADQTQSLV